MERLLEELLTKKLSRRTLLEKAGWGIGAGAGLLLSSPRVAESDSSSAEFAPGFYRSPQLLDLPSELISLSSEDDNPLLGSEGLARKTKEQQPQREGWFPLELRGSWVISGFIDRNDPKHLFVSHENGVQELKVSAGTQTSEERNYWSRRILGGFTYQITPDNKGGMYLLGQGGATYLSKEGEPQGPYVPLLEGKPVELDIFGLPRGIYVEPYLWTLSVTTPYLYRFSLENNEWKAYQVPWENPWVEQLAIESDGESLWIGGRFNLDAPGLWRFYPEREEFQPIEGFQDRNVLDLKYLKLRGMIVALDDTYNWRTHEYSVGGLRVVDTSSLGVVTKIDPPPQPPPGTRFIYIGLREREGKIGVMTRSPIQAKSDGGFHGISYFSLGEVTKSGRPERTVFDGVPNLSYTAENGAELFGTWSNGAFYKRS